MHRQLSFAEARRRGPRIAVLPDAARVEERLGRLARERGFVPGRVAYSLAELGRELIREAQRAGACPEVASPFALELALRQAAREHSPGPYFGIRNHAGYARALGDLLAALTEGLLEPVELAALDVPERPVALGRTLIAARAALDRAALVDPHQALRLAVEHLERGGPLPSELARAAEVEFEGVLDWTPLRLRLAAGTINAANGNKTRRLAAFAFSPPPVRAGRSTGSRARRPARMRLAPGAGAGDRP